MSKRKKIGGLTRMEEVSMMIADEMRLVLETETSAVMSRAFLQTIVNVSAKVGKAFGVHEDDLIRAIRDGYLGIPNTGDDA